MEAKTGSEDTRKWNSGVGLWGKRSTPAIEDQQLLAFVDGQPVRDFTSNVQHALTFET
jgi:hypothetical protein